MVPEDHDQESTANGENSHSIDQAISNDVNESDSFVMEMLPTPNVATRKRRHPKLNDIAYDLIEDYSVTHFNTKTTPTETESSKPVRKMLKNSLLTYSTTDDSSTFFDSETTNVKITVQLEVHQTDKSISQIASPASTSNAEPIAEEIQIPPRNARSNSASASNGMTAKHKVGFDTSCVVHEKSKNAEVANNEQPKVMMKGGKWRRTIVELRKTKISQCKYLFIIQPSQDSSNCKCTFFSVPRLTSQFNDNRNSQQSNRRKSVYIKDVRFSIHNNNNAP